MTLGNRLKKYRAQKGWNQRELARAAQIDHAWISRVESGERHNLSLEAAKRLALALGISLDVLAGMPGTPRPRPTPALAGEGTQ